MKISGFIDEAADALDVQIAVAQELGWQTVALRKIDGVESTLMPDADFDRYADQLEDAGIGVCEFGSRIACKESQLPSTLDRDLEELRRIIPRAQRFGTRFVRCMSYPKSRDYEISDTDWLDEIVRRFQTLAPIAADAGIVLAHENCSGYGARGAAACREIFERVNHPGFCLTLDTGNMKGEGPGSAWQWYEELRDVLTHFHIKDTTYNADGTHMHCPAGQGQSGADRVIEDLRTRGYDGFLVMEPHVLVGKKRTEHPNGDTIARKSFLECGRALSTLVGSSRLGK